MLTQKELDEIRNRFPKCPKCKDGRITKAQYAVGMIQTRLYDFCDSCGARFAPEKSGGEK